MTVNYERSRFSTPFGPATTLYSGRESPITDTTYLFVLNSVSNLIITMKIRPSASADHPSASCSLLFVLRWREVPR